MKSDSDFDPSKVAAALHVLEAGLREELTGEDAAQALGLLRLELVTVILDARAWAKRRGIPAGEVPEPPDAGASAEECLASLRNLAAALRQLGSRPTKSRNRRARRADEEKTMRDVLQRLRERNAEALLELAELDCAMHEVLRHLEALDGDLQRLHADVAAILVNEEDPSGLEALCLIEESSDRASAACEELVRAFRQICGAIASWSATEARQA